LLNHIHEFLGIGLVEITGRPSALHFPNDGLLLGVPDAGERGYKEKNGQYREPLFHLPTSFGYLILPVPWHDTHYSFHELQTAQKNA
jgi:hypothetical protein